MMNYSNYQRVKALIAIVLINFSFQSFAINYEPLFYNFSSKNGLPSSECYYVFQDSKEFIWICTDKGVVKYDGYNFTTFTTENGLTNNVVFKVVEDKEGKIWFLGLGNEICYFINNKIHAYKYNYKIKKVLGERHIRNLDFLIESDGTIYFQIQQFGTIIIKKNGLIKIIKSKPDYIEIRKTKNKYFWVGGDCSFGSLLYNKTNGQKFHLPYSKYFNFIKSFSYKNDYFINFRNHIYSAKQNKYIVIDTSILSIYVDYDFLWYGLYTRGVKAVSTKKESGLALKYHFLKNLTVTNIIKDLNNGYWFSTLEKGIFYTPTLNVLNSNLSLGLMSENVISIGGIKNYIFLGYLNQWQLISPFVFNNTSEFTTSKIGFTNNAIYISGETKHSNYNLFPKLKCYHIPFFNNYYNHNDTLYTTDLIIVKNFENKFIDTLYNQYSLQKGTIDLVTALIIYNNKKLVGTNYGLYELMNKKLNNQNYKDLSQYKINNLKYDKNFGLIISTKDQGLIFYDGKNITKKLNKKTGLLSNSISSLFFDNQNRLWVGTNNGVNIISIKNDEFIIQSITTVNGLISNEVNSIYINCNDAYVGTKEGLSKIDVKNYFKPQRINKLHLLSLSGTTENSNFPNYFTSDEKLIKIQFRTTNYKTAQNPTYRYRLSKSSEWQLIKTPEITLNYPSPNEYNLEIQALDENGNWSSNSLKIPFKVEYPFYNRWYFYLICSLFLLLSMHLIFKYRLKKTNEKYQTQKLIKNLESKALRSQMNPHFIFNALNSIQSFLIFEENEKAEKYLIKFAYLIRQTLNNSRSTYITIENELNILERYLDLEKMRFKSKFSYDINFNVPEKFKTLFIPPMLIQPYIENAIIHAFKDLPFMGHIQISFQIISPKKAFCIIEDNGIGINKNANSKSKQHESYGRTITSERLEIFSKNSSEKYQITTSISNAESDYSGTKVTIEIPIFDTNDEL
jgi:hypothetical protein